MKLVIDTQYMENYGAHDWDGEGACPQRWKAKGGSSFMVECLPGNVDVESVVAMIRKDIERSDDYCQEYILGYRLEDDGYMSEFERSQLEYEGEVTYKEPRVQYSEMMARHMELAND